MQQIDTKVIIRVFIMFSRDPGCKSVIVCFCLMVVENLAARVL
jgi:hypothetical protein